MEDIKNAILEIQENVKKSGQKMLLVEADSEKGFSYPYVLCYTNGNMSKTLVMECLNDYEEPMGENEIENIEAKEIIHGLFGKDRVLGDSKFEYSGKVQESKEKSLARISDRIQLVTNNLKLMETNFLSNVPIIMPLIPGYISGEIHENTASELGPGVAKELAPQILAMIENAKELLMERTSISLDDKIISFGHSKSSTFADHFSMLYPEKVKAIIIGGTEYAALPIEEIRLIVDNNKKESEQFEIRGGIPYKKITQKEFNEIIQEYNEHRTETQRKININDDGSYSLPMNYPLGMADIEQYIRDFPNRQTKEEYIRKFAKIPRVIFVGEDEEQVEGHYAYSSGKTLEGQYIQQGEDLAPFEHERYLFEIEHAGMHNRVLDYVSARRILFGRSNNERLTNYMDLCLKLGMNIQSKIYKDVGHRGIYKSKALTDDFNNIYNTLTENNAIPDLNDNERASRISPVHQLVRRYKVSKSKQEFDSKKQKWIEFTKRNKSQGRSEEHEKIIGRLQKEIDYYLSQKYDLENLEVSIDSIYDNLTTSELVDIFDRVFDIDKIQTKKTISMQSVISNASIQGIVAEHVLSSKKNEHKQMQEQPNRNN